MRKLLLFLLILALGLFVGVPGAVGFGLESRGPTLIQNLDASLGQYEIRAGAIERGWFSSHVELDVRRSDGRPVFTYPLKLRHGPWAGRFAWLHGAGALEAPNVGKLGHLAWTIKLSTGLNAVLDLKEAAGVVGQAQLDTEAGYQKGQLTVPAWNAPGIMGLIGTLDFDLAAGVATVAATIDEASAPTFVHSDVSLEGAFMWESPWLDVDVSMDSRNYQLRYVDVAFAPYATRVHLTHLDQRVLGQAFRLRDSASLLALLPTLLEGQPRLEIFEVEAHHPEGTFNGEMALFLTQPPPAGFLSNIDQLMSVLEGRGTHRIDPPLLRSVLDTQLKLRGAPDEERPYQVDATFAQLLENKMMQPLSDGQLGGEMTLKGGELRFNGQLNRRWRTSVLPASP